MPTFDEFQERVRTFQSDGMALFATTSFQGHSVPMLHMLARIDVHIPVYYVDTGYLFPETLRFRDQLKEMLGLTFVGLRPPVPKSQQRDANGALMYTWDPDRCCHLNKVQPMERVLAEFDVWVNGVRADQSAARRAMRVEQPAGHGCLRYHPMLDWDMRKVFAYRTAYGLPEHPLEAEGYVSIGCEPCTRKLMDGFDERSGRWFGLSKTECGLNTELVQGQEAVPRKAEQ